MSRGGRKKRTAGAGTGDAPARKSPGDTGGGGTRSPRVPQHGRAGLRRAGKRAGGIVLAAALALIAWRACRYSLPGPLGSTELPPPREAPPVSRATQADFVGAERCAKCHAAEYDKWKVSTHGRAGGPPSPELVIAAFNGRPIRFRDAVVTPRVTAGRYEFVVSRDDDSTEIVPVDGVIGGGHMEGGGTQGFVTKRPDGTLRFVPFDWSRQGATWFCNTNSRSGRGWVPITETMRLSECGDWPPARVLGDTPRWANCQSCHASQLRVENLAAGRTTNYTSLAINCESCHGPARRHVELAESGALARAGDTGLPSLGTLGKDASLAVCFQCHSVKDQLREGYVSGDSLELFYSLKFPALGDRPLHPDGRVRTFAYQEAHRYSDCYVNGGMTCTSCHDPHSQGYRTVTGEPLPGRFDDRQCTSCHPSKAERVAEHTHHAEASPGSRCVACHMPYLQAPETTDPLAPRAAVRFARSDHSIAIPRPRADSAVGVMNACAACHANRSTKQLDDQVRAWWGPLKPFAGQIAPQLFIDRTARKGTAPPPLVLGDGSTIGAAATHPALLIPDTVRAPRHPAAVFAGLARFIEEVRAPDSVRFTRDARVRLDALARSPDVDIRALALATLHLAAGNDAAVRRRLARAASAEGAHDFALRSRWAVALGYMGDRYAERGDYPAARTAYSRALAAMPSARLLQSLGNAERGAGDLGAAINSYEGALAMDGRDALVMVNLGITLGAAGDSVRGEAMLRKAADTDPGEPLAWFNLGNVALLKGDFAAASRHLQRALAIDGGLVQAHFQLARMYVIQRDNRSALLELRRGLAVDSSDATARGFARQLEAAIRR